jgi:hypothetical protein
MMLKESTERNILYLLTLMLIIYLVNFISNLNPLIHPEKVSNLTYLWDPSINDILKPFNSCRLDACIGRFRPLDYVFELLDALYLKYQIISTSNITWTPISTYIGVIISPLLFVFNNHRNKILCLVFVFLFFSSFQFLSDYYNYFRPGKHLAFMFFIITSYLVIFKFDNLLNKIQLKYLPFFIIPALFDEQIIMFLFFYSAVFFIIKRKINTINLSLIIIFVLYLAFTLGENITAIETIKYLRDDSYSSKENIIKRINLFLSNSFILNLETIKFVFLNNKFLSIIVSLVSTIIIANSFYTKNNFLNKLSKTKNYAVSMYLISGLFIFVVSAILHPGIIWGKTQGLAYYFLIPGFIYVYTIFITFENIKIKLSNINISYLLKIILIISLPFIVQRNINVMENNLKWHPNVWVEVNKKIKNNDPNGYNLHTWQSGAHLTTIVNNGCDFKSINMKSIGDIEKKIYKEYICESFLRDF